MLKTPHIARNVMADLIGHLPLVLLLLLACSCAKTLTREDPNELTFRPVASSITKADPELSGTSLGNNNSYVILASASATGEPEYLTGQLFAYFASTGRWMAASASGPGIAGNYTHAAKSWPLSGTTVDFLALALRPVAYTHLTEDPGSITWYNASQGGSAGGVTIANWDTYANQYDVMYAVKNGQSVGTSTDGNISLEFQHTQAVVGFSARSTVSGTGGVFTLKGITLNGLNHVGTMTIDNTKTEVETVWSSLTSADKPMLKKDANPATAELNYSVSYVSTPAQCTQHLLVIPQASRSATLTYRVQNSVTDLTVNLPLPRLNWKAGHRYIYNLVFTPTEIQVESVTVSELTGSDIVHVGGILINE